MSSSEKFCRSSFRQFFNDKTFTAATIASGGNVEVVEAVAFTSGWLLSAAVRGSNAVCVSLKADSTLVDGLKFSVEVGKPEDSIDRVSVNGFVISFSVVEVNSTIQSLKCDKEKNKANLNRFYSNANSADSEGRYIGNVVLAKDLFIKNICA